MAYYGYGYSRDLFRSYYGPSLTQVPTEQQPLYTHHAQKPWYPSPNYMAVGIGAGALFATGYIPTRGGRMWDFYTKTVRTAEEYSPGGILRTFQISNIMSQLESSSRQSMTITGEQLRQNSRYRHYLTQLIGGPNAGAVNARLAREGVRLDAGKLYWAQKGDVALKYAARMASPQEASFNIGTAYARSMGVGLSTSDILINEKDFSRMFVTGGHTRRQVFARQAGALGTEYVSRFNRLLQQPFEMQPFSTIFGGINKGISRLTGGRITRLAFDVPESSGLKMLGALSLKYGLGAGALYMGYQTIDYMARNASILNNTIFAEGVTAGIATVGVRANVLTAEVAQATGLQAYREKQEEIAPGSTNLGKLLAFPLIGAVGAAGASYLANIKLMLDKQFKEGISLNQARAAAAEQMGTFGQKNILAQAGRWVSRREGIYSRQDILGRIAKRISTPDEAGDLIYKFFGKVTPTKLAGLVGAGLGLAAVAPFLPGALIPETPPDELRAIYSGEQEVAVRKGRWWEFGRSPYEGQRVMYHRPHWYPRLIDRARERSIWREEEGQELSPFRKFLKREFTYDLERMHYEDRPYPITSLPFEDVPFIGPLLANTLGRLIKPPKLMHTEEWMTEGGGVLAEQPGFGQTVATEIGETPHGVPVSPYSPTQVIGEQAYRLTEMIGLPGFTMSSIKEAITGSPDLFDQVRQLESARRIAGAERAYWDLEIGGGMGTTEAVRRLFPHRRRQIPLYNPIRNTMPDWLPGTGEKGPDLLHGDPYSTIQEGELRLPGVGYETRFPELKGIDPENYPLVHRYRILADVAPYTDKFKQARAQVRMMRKSEAWDEYSERLFQVTEAQIKEKKQRKTFEEYEYLPETGNVFDRPTAYGADTGSGLITALNNMKAEGREKPGLFKRMFGGYWEMLAHNAETSIDVLTPVSPAAKLIHTRTAIEDYERTQVFGTENAFWQHPVRDFLAPFARLTALGLGYDATPSHIENVRSVESYFDTLKYVKNTRLANMARIAGDKKALKEFETNKDETLFGINPFTRNYTNVFRSLPRRDRDYFSSFEKAGTVEERQRILELVPENEKALYAARWKLAFAQDIKKAQKAGILSENQLEEADQILDTIYEEAKNEGLPRDKELFAEYLATRHPGENYADWYRRTKLLPDVPLPGPDWVGWHPSVDLEDIKLKVVMNAGEDMHEYNLWPSRAMAMVDKPYINDEAIKPITQPDDLSPEEVRDRIDSVLLTNGVRADTFFSTSWTGDNSISIDAEQDIDISGDGLL